MEKRYRLYWEKSIQTARKSNSSCWTIKTQTFEGNFSPWLQEVETYPLYKQRLLFSWSESHPQQFSPPILLVCKADYNKNWDEGAQPNESFYPWKKVHQREHQERLHRWHDLQAISISKELGVTIYRYHSRRIIFLQRWKRARHLRH